MSKLSILDCTLRDGGYINHWDFGKETIHGIVNKLHAADIDIIECGFLRDVPYDENVAVFSCVSQITPFITPKKAGVMYVALLAIGDIAPEKYCRMMVCLLTVFVWHFISMNGRKPKKLPFT